MRPRDFDDSGPDRAEKFLQQLEAWERRRDELSAACSAAAQELVTRQQQTVAPAAWLAAAQAALTASAAQVGGLASVAAELAAVAAEVTRTDGDLADVRQARAISTARLLAGPVAGAAVTLLPLRLETRWLDDGLYARIYPDDLLLRTHDERLTADERTWGTHYWEVRGGAVAADEEQTWLQLVRRFGPQRAAWVVRACDPAGPVPEVRDDGWPRPARVDLVPDRFAVVAYAAGEPVDLAGPGEEPTFVAWGAPVAGPLDLTEPGGPVPAAWTTDLRTAIEAGMAVRLPVPAGAPPIDLLVAIGLRGGDHPGTDARALADLLTAHAYTGGFELLADGTPTNNSVAVNSAFSPERQTVVARRLVPGVNGADAVPADGTAGAELAGVLGLPRDVLGPVEGAAAPRTAWDAAAGLLAALAAGGAMTAQLGGIAELLRPLVRPGGPAPVLRTGRQPYAVLPATAPGRWEPAAGELGAGLTALMHRWAAANASALDADPNIPIAPVGGGVPRRVTRSDAADLPELLLEAPESVAWTAADGTTFELAGPAEFLSRLASTPSSQLAGLAGTVPPTLLARVAFAAKRAAPPEVVPAVDAALTALAGAGPGDLARLFGGHLDTASHRFDPWVTAVVTERLAASRAAHADLGALGAVGWVTDVAPRTGSVPSEHVLAPSLGHAATAAVLRSAYLGQSGTSRHTAAGPMEVDLSSRRVRQALWLLDAVRAGQPLAAVLGYQFERDLADAGLQPYLAAFRKLTRFRAGTALEALEDTRREQRRALLAAEARLAELTAATEAARPALAAATAARADAGARLDRADAAAAPYDRVSAALAATVGTEIPTLTAELAAIDRRRPQSRRQVFTLQVP